MSYNFEQYVDVWESNLHSSLKELIGLIESDRRPNQKTVIAIDTEFPGDPEGSDPLLYKPGRSQAAYEIMKRNVDATKMISLG